MSKKIKFSASTIEDIKTKTSISDLIASYGIQLRRAGASISACCPFHNEKTPSFHINEAKGVYHCFGCGESGDIFHFVEKMEGIPFADAVEKLADACGVKLEATEDPQATRRKRLYSLMAELAAFYHRCLIKTKEAQIARDYLEKRSLDTKTQEDFLIGYAPNGIKPILSWAEKYGFTTQELEDAGVIKAPTKDGDLGYHRFGGRLMFTIKDRQGRVVAFSGRLLSEKKNTGKYVNSPETLIFTKGKVLFAFDRASSAIAKSPTREVICCEGQIDTIRLHISGFPTAVASQGTAFTEDHAQLINQVADAALLLYDDDAAGRKATIKVARVLLQRGMPVRIVTLPPGEDPDSFLLQYGREALQEKIKCAESIIAFQFRIAKFTEQLPLSIDAVARVSKAMLETIACSSSAILRASMIDEASRLLKIPVSALNEEFSKIKISPPARTLSLPEDAKVSSEPLVSDFDESTSPILGQDAGVVAPPNDREFALMSFLMAHERDESLAHIIQEFLPIKILFHHFTKQFVETWLNELSTADDLFSTFHASLEPYARAWFDKIIAESAKVQGSDLSATNILLDQFARNLWCDYLERKRGELKSDKESDLMRAQLVMKSSILQMSDDENAVKIMRTLVEENA